MNIKVYSFSYEVLKKVPRKFQWVHALIY